MWRIDHCSAHETRWLTCPVYRDGDRRGAPSRSDREHLGQRLANIQRLNRRIIVVGAVTPYAIYIDYQLTAVSAGNRFGRPVAVVIAAENIIYIGVATCIQETTSNTSVLCYSPDFRLWNAQLPTSLRCLPADRITVH